MRFGTGNSRRGGRPRETIQGEIMRLPGILEFTKQLLGGHLSPGDVCLDATAGNGRDTAFLAERVGPEGVVYAFDVQREALDAASARLTAAGLAERVRLIRDGHEHLARHVAPEHVGRIRAATYNLGYLPGGDHGVVTRAATTLASLEALLPLLDEGGLATIHIYTGHPGGAAEGEQVAGWAAALDFGRYRVLRMDFPNKPRNRETLLVVQVGDGRGGKNGQGRS